ncbi:hypothetical protein BGLA2_810049 [Burkholderia gladioli]|nr:hypothetical protein BGLA2_810049 [Burkholderia gladioli]
MSWAYERRKIATECCAMNFPLSRHPIELLFELTGCYQSTSLPGCATDNSCRPAES